MHSRIFELSRKPVSIDDRISSDDIPEWFCASVADYVDDEDVSREGDIEWLLSGLGEAVNYDKESEKLTFKESEKRLYFKSSFCTFKECLEELSRMSIGMFSYGTDRLGSLMYRLNEAYNRKYGFYIYFSDELFTLDEWVRDSVSIGDFYIGGIIDYHC